MARISAAFTASGRWDKTSDSILIPRSTSLPSYLTPSNVRIIYKTAATFDESTICQYLETIMDDKKGSVLYLDSARCHKTKNVMNKFDTFGVKRVIIPPRLTNLLQPADVCWFSKIKKLYCAKWNEWSINVEKNLTVYDAEESDDVLGFDNDCVSETVTEEDEIGRLSLNTMVNNNVQLISQPLNIQLSQTNTQVSEQPIFLPPPQTNSQVTEQTCYIPHNQNNNQLLDRHFCTPQTFRYNRVSSQPFNLLTAGLSQDTSLSSQHMNNGSVYLSARNINFDSFSRDVFPINSQLTNGQLILNHQNEFLSRKVYNNNQIQHTQETRVQAANLKENIPLRNVFSDLTNQQAVSNTKGVKKRGRKPLARDENGKVIRNL
ncbi:unnamed protein product [Brachionus calyciflorus]|uniref:DDE-1 domain-containing protein n=1 Tax=Brachionus calyciflorus TaxID=104777 RepID=A0A814G2M0_9BILA|nr:unnamed protein product [Brachionus calyciflorus]